MNLGLTADEVLTTTRSVRKRLDLTRDVPHEVLVECVEIATQAPTGGNQQGWSFVFVRDADKKRALAEMYARHFDPYAASRPEPPFPEGDPRRAQMERVAASAQHLRDHLHEVPVMCIPLIAGRLDGLPVFPAASAWGSILPAVWSFMLALRERGLGSAWTTLHLPSEREAAELLGIPYDSWTQAGLFPVAYTIGTDFAPASRRSVAKLVHVDTFGNRPDL